MRCNHPSPRWPVRLFRVVEDSMRPTLKPGDGLVAVRWPRARRGQVRVFPDPTTSDRLTARWLVKRVGEVSGSGSTARFEARSDNPGAAGVVDSRRFGPVPVAGSYRVVRSVSGPKG